jgi:hypothetical protein
MNNEYSVLLKRQTEKTDAISASIERERPEPDMNRDDIEE